jgi:hypothetical protein
MSLDHIGVYGQREKIHDVWHFSLQSSVAWVFRAGTVGPVVGFSDTIVDIRMRFAHSLEPSGEKQAGEHPLIQLPLIEYKLAL